MATTALTVDVRQLQAFAKGLEDATTEGLGQAVVQSVNDVVDRSYDLARTRINAGINLTDDYVRRKMRVEHATPGRPVASIIAIGGAAGTTNLSHYAPQQVLRDVNWSNARIQAMGMTFGAWPGWTRRTGSQTLGIKPDQKAAGRSVEVGRGKRKAIGPAFAIPGKKDSEGNYLVFRRTAAGKIESLVGPSVYQLFRYQIPLISEGIETDLASTLVEYAEAELQKALT